jgi:EmrB/QacA subfamily drug resistance transporter
MTNIQQKKESKDNLKWWVLVTVIIGTFLGRLDQTIVNLALPKIILDFQVTVSAAGWIATAYILANAVFVPVWGKLGDSLGRKKIYILGFSIFIIGSILAGLSWNLSSMIVFRIIQAIAASADYPTAMAILTITFKAGKERAQALGLWSASFAAAVVFGPLIGGPLIDLFGWRSVFLMNIPIGIVGMIMALTFIKESKSENKDMSFDWIGAITLGIALSALVLVLDQGMSWGWGSSYSLACYGAILIFGAIFYFVEKNHKEPIIDFKFFKNRIFVGTLMNNFIVFMGMMGGVFLIPVFVQTFLGYSATQTGYLFIPMAFFMMIAAQIGGKLIGKVRYHHVIFISTLIASIGIYLFVFFIDARASAWAIIFPLSVMSFGIGLGMAQRTNAIAAIVPEKEIGIASSILALIRNIAGAFGIAIFATILENVTNSNVLNVAQHTVIYHLTSATYQQAAALVILKAQISAYATVFTVSALIVLIGAVISLFVKIKNEEVASKANVHVEA